MNITSSNRKSYKWTSFIKDFFYGFIAEYETSKIITIHHFSIGILLRILQIILLIYSILYLFLYEKGYQMRDSSIISSVTLKVKGIGYIHTSNTETYALDGTGNFFLQFFFFSKLLNFFYFKDYTIPSLENNAIFIMTSFIQTDQTRSKCAESKSSSQAICQTDSDCQTKHFLSNANGRWTGRCLLPLEVEANNTINHATGLCEMQGKL